MTDTRRYSSYAVLRELSSRELKRRLGLFPPEMRYYAILASSIIGAENAKRVEETPEAVMKDSREFVEQLFEVANPAGDEAFRGILETCLIEAIKDELRYYCPNCANFTTCLDIENLSVGLLFQKCVEEGETDELKNSIALEVAEALKNTPHMETENAHVLCRDFRHHYLVSGLGEIFSRYSRIAGEFRDSFGIDYRKIQQEMISLNLEFYERSLEGKNHADRQADSR